MLCALLGHGQNTVGPIYLNSVKTLCFLFLITPLMAWANPNGRKNNFVDHVHAKLSSDILKVATSIDNFFGTKRADDEDNDTRIRIYTISTKLEGENPFTEGNVKLQLVLPKTQKRLQLIIQNDNEDEDETKRINNSAIQGRRASSSKTSSQAINASTENTTAGLRYILDTAGVRTSLDGGLRFEGTPVLFYRLRFRRNIMFKQWSFRPIQQIFWSQNVGHVADTNLDFDYSYNKIWSVRLVNDINWNDTDYVIRFSNGPSWFQQLNEKMAMSYNFRLLSANSPIHAVNDYSFSVGFRQLLYQNWFFWSVIPAVNFPREENFHRTPSLTIRFDAILGSI
jgi:hypothetical protein